MGMPKSDFCAQAEMRLKCSIYRIEAESSLQQIETK